jgi:tRNA(Met) cytidine acetyltransferase
MAVIIPQCRRCCPGVKIALTQANETAFHKAMTRTRPSHIELALELQTSARRQRHRRLLLLSGEPASCRQQAWEIVQALEPKSALWIGDQAPSGTTALSNDQALQRLGDEVDLLVYDAFCGFDPDAFGAISGTLRGGGLLLLLTPRLDAWPDYPDPEYTRLVVAGESASDFGGSFLQRLSNLLQTDPLVTRIVEGEIQGRSAPASTVTHPPPETVDGCLTPDQHQAVAAIEQVVHGHRKRPLVLSSDRGRGKSSALGIAAARLMLETRRRILVTAPRRSAVDALFQQARRLLPEAEFKSGELRAAGSSLVYTAPDHLLSTSHTADLVLVDEAAAIPTALLQALLEHYPRLVFATTVHGYEGTGRGFALRFRGYLDRLSPQWRELRLVSPIRWAGDDPLEALVFRLLGLDSEPAADEFMSSATPETVELLIPDSDWLLQHEKVLQQLFGLLVLAHYRTSPRDLRLLLDAPNLQILLLRQGEEIAGAALVSMEGGFDSELSREIWAGNRRPRGHLMAQSLAAHVGLPLAPKLKGVRVMRIAIHPAAQRRRLGSRLLQAIRDYATRRGCDYLGTSFGVSEDLLRFWLENHLKPVRLGLRSGTSSGEHALLMVSPISREGEGMATRAQSRFARQFAALLGDPLRDLSASIAASLLLATEMPEPVALNEEDWSDLAGFAYRHRGFETSLPAIQRLTLLGLGSDALSSDERSLLLMRVVQKRSWEACAQHAGFSGRTETERRLREIMASLFQRFADDTASALLREFDINP